MTRLDIIFLLTCFVVAAAPCVIALISLRQENRRDQ